MFVLDFQLWLPILVQDHAISLDHKASPGRLWKIRQKKLLEYHRYPLLLFWCALS